MPTWPPSDARRTWLLSHGRARDDARIDADHDAYRYLGARGLAPAVAEGAVGILHPDLEPHLPPAVRWWPRAGYRIVVPLVDITTGDILEVQARSIDPRARVKTVFPRGGRGTGRMFASRGAREILAGCSDESVVIVAEGLTDYLALVWAASCPVVGCAGVSMAASIIGPWASGRHVVIALDCDEAGERAAQDVADRVDAQGGVASRLAWPDGHVDACDVLAARGDGGLIEVVDRAVEEVRACTMSQ